MSSVRRSNKKENKSRVGNEVSASKHSHAEDMLEDEVERQSEGHRARQAN